MEGKGDRLSVIIPTYNERGNMPLIIPRLANLLSDEGIPHEILVMDDDSPDGTCDAVKALGKKYSHVRCVLRKENKGLSPAVMDGYREARGDIYLVMDADLSHPVEKVPEMYRAISERGAQISVGSRHAKDGGIENWPLRRKVISFGASMLARPLTPCSDPMSGFFAVRPSVVEGAPLRAKGYKILLEVLVKGNYDRSRIEEVPITFRDREVGESKLGSKVIVNYIQHLIKLYMFPGSAPFFKFLFVGGTGFLFDEGLFALMVFALGKANDNIWQGLSFSVAVVWNFIWNRIWTFKATDGKGLPQFLKFATVAVVAFMIRTFLYVFGKRITGASDELQLMALLFVVIIIVTVINYIGSKLWAFKK